MNTDRLVLHFDSSAKENTNTANTMQPNSLNNHSSKSKSYQLKFKDIKFSINNLLSELSTRGGNINSTKSSQNSLLLSQKARKESFPLNLNAGGNPSKLLSSHHKKSLSVATSLISGNTPNQSLMHSKPTNIQVNKKSSNIEMADPEPKDQNRLTKKSSLSSNIELFDEGAHAAEVPKITPRNMDKTDIKNQLMEIKQQFANISRQPSRAKGG